MPFKRPGKDTFYTWATACDGTRRQLSTGTKLEKEAKRIEAWLDELRERFDKQGVLAAIVAGDLKLAEAYQAGPDAGALLRRKQASEANPDLRVHFDEWISEEVADGLSSAEGYRQMVDDLYPTSLRPSDLTTVDIRKRVLGVPDIQSPTRNRYLSALSSFCRWCARHGHLPRNPVRDVEKFSENESPMRLWTPEEAQRIITALPRPFNAVCALMGGAGWEFAACENALVSDLHLEGNPPTAFAHGTKNRWRQRQCVVTEAWALPVLRDAVAGREPEEALFPGIYSDIAVRTLQRVLAALKLPRATNHDWRHSHAVWLLERGELPSTVAHQLGHKNTQLLWERYGRFVVTTRHYRSVTLSAPIAAATLVEPPPIAAKESAA